MVKRKDNIFCIFVQFNFLKAEYFTGQTAFAWLLNLDTIILQIWTRISTKFGKDFNRIWTEFEQDLDRIWAAFDRI